MEPPYSDPIRGQLDALERSIEFSFEYGDFFCERPERFEDELCRPLNALEASIEETVVPPVQHEPLVVPPVPSGPMSQGSTNPGPQPPPESDEGPWITLQPAPAARPFFTRDGLAPPSYRAPRGGSTGVRSEGASKMTRLCPETNEFVDEEETCQNDCEEYRDWGAGFEQCYHDWLEDKGNDQGQSDDEHGQVEE